MTSSNRDWRVGYVIDGHPLVLPIQLSVLTQESVHVQIALVHHHQEW